MLPVPSFSLFFSIDMFYLNNKQDPTSFTANLAHYGWTVTLVLFALSETWSCKLLF